jgi:hypothetical protein
MLTFKTTLTVQILTIRDNQVMSVYHHTHMTHIHRLETNTKHMTKLTTTIPMVKNITMIHIRINSRLHMGLLPQFIIHRTILTSIINKMDRFMPIRMNMESSLTILTKEAILSTSTLHSISKISSHNMASLCLHLMRIRNLSIPIITPKT